MYVSIAATSPLPGGVHLGFLSVTGLDACRGLPAASEGLDITFCLVSQLCSVIQEEKAVGDTGMENKNTLEICSLAEKSSLKDDRRLHSRNYEDGTRLSHLQAVNIHTDTLLVRE